MLQNPKSISDDHQWPFAYPERVLGYIFLAERPSTSYYAIHRAGGKPLERPLKHHIASLEQRLRTLNAKVMDNNLTLAKRNRVERDIRAALLAISYYRKALAIEDKLNV
ncbi:MAG: hypothetical protein DMG92_03685 [Acidobacteria bacterium]|nr:MAG: hypothetical protein DMG92_03685 [Acidobacteriota bacterium]